MGAASCFFSNAMVYAVQRANLIGASPPWESSVGAWLVLVLASIAAFALAVLPGAVSWAFQFAAVGVVYAVSGWWLARRSGSIGVRAGVLLAPWVLVYGGVAVSNGLARAYPIVAIGVVGVAAGVWARRSTDAQGRFPLFPALGYGVVLALGAWVAMPNWIAANRPSLRDESPAPPGSVAFAFEDASGAERVRVPTDLRGRTVVLEFWTTSCTACFAGFPDLDAFAASYRDDPRVAVYAVNLRDSLDAPGRAREMMEPLGYGFETGYADLSFEEARAVYGFRGVPAVVLYAPDGSIPFAGSPEFEPQVFVHNVDRAVRRTLAAFGPE